MMNVLKISTLAFVLIFGTAMATTPKEAKSDAEIKEILIEESKQYAIKIIVVIVLVRTILIE